MNKICGAVARDTRRPWVAERVRGVTSQRRHAVADIGGRVTAPAAAATALDNEPLHIVIVARS